AGTVISLKPQERGKGLDQEGEEPVLTTDDPLPQTVYRALIRRRGVLLVTLQLLINSVTRK
ncbi:MAG: hypothetical protein ACREAC_30545, partial [Blastocatellia bacterium]